MTKPAKIAESRLFIPADLLNGCAVTMESHCRYRSHRATHYDLKFICRTFRNRAGFPKEWFPPGRVLFRTGVPQSRRRRGTKKLQAGQHQSARRCHESSNVAGIRSLHFFAGNLRLAENLPAKGLQTSSVRWKPDAEQSDERRAVPDEPSGSDHQQRPCGHGQS